MQLPAETGKVPDAVLPEPEGMGVQAVPGTDQR